MDSIHRIFCCRFSKNDMLLDMNNNNASIHIVDDDCFDTNGSGNERKDAKVRFAETDSAISPPLASSPSASSKSPSARSPAKSPARSPASSSSASSRSRTRSPSRPSGSGKSPGRSPARSSSAPSAKSTSAASITIPGEAKDYLPKFIVNRFGDDEIPIVADSCQLKSKFHGKNGIIQHRYTVAWIEEDDGPIHREAMKLPKKSKSKNTKNGKSKVGGERANVSRVAKSPRRKCCETADLQTKKSYPRSSVVVKRNLSSIATLKSEEPSQTSPNREIGVEIGMKGGDGRESEYRKCDGPCGEKRPVADLRTLGRCDHAICSVCVIRAPMVPSEDGSMGCCNKRCFAIDLVNEIPDANRRHELYQQIFKKQKFDEIFKLYKGDILRAKFPRKDLNSQYSTSSASASPSATSVTSTATTTTNASSSAAASSTSSLKPAMGPPALYETISSLNENGSENESGTETSGKYDLPPPSSTTASQTSASSSSQTPSEYSCSTVYESARASVSLENPPVIAHEIFMLRLVILESSYFSTIKRHRFDEELGAKVPLLAAVESLMGISAGRNLYNSTTRIFYCPDENMKTTESMLEMNAKEHAQLTMEELATEWGKICIIIDYTGKLVKDQRKPFKQSSVKKEK